MTGRRGGHARADALTTIAADWRLPHGADWHRKHRLLRAHLATGAAPALTRNTQLVGVKIGTPDSNPLAPARRARRTFGETVQLLELFLHREGCAPAVHETIRVDGDTVRIGA